MKAIIVDDESYCADYLEELCEELPQIELVGKFDNALNALKFLDNSQVDLAFLDISMPGITGMEAVGALREKNPAMGVIFVTGFEQYAMDAFRADAIAYLLKPCSLEDLQKAVDKAGRLLPASGSRVAVRTFGRFSVFLDGEPLRFSNRKAKELLALLIDRQGAIVSMEQAVSLLWEGRPYDSSVKQLYRKAVIYLHQFLDEKRLDFFVSNRGSCHILPAKVECDYFQLMAGDQKAIQQFFGEYMTDYSWSEETLGRIYQYLNHFNPTQF